MSLLTARVRVFTHAGAAKLKGEQKANYTSMAIDTKLIADKSAETTVLLVSARLTATGTARVKSCVFIQ